ncbi:MAG: anthranilate synthase component I family protein [Propionibacteriaceae bacterium]|nr:anthranilate synthase component I family protein [Propionibacteriaceae bacterium]
MINPTLDDLRALGGYPLLPVWIESEITRGPAEAFLVLKRLSKQAYILESLEDTGERGRYTFLGYDPKLEITCVDGVTTIKGQTTRTAGDPAAEISRILEQNRTPIVDALPPFTGGLVGYFSFDYFQYAEPALKLKAEDTEGFKDADLMLFDKVIAYDHLEGKLFLIANIRAENLEEEYAKAESELAYLAQLIAAGEPAQMPKLQLESDWRELLDERRYAQMVAKAKDYIVDGDIFQVVLSNRLDADASGSLYETYLLLREVNPSPYMFYFSSDDLEIAGASPETLVRSRGGEAVTFPLAGTRRRGKDAEEDAALEAELLADEKELAEHNMLVDLGRNDIGKLSEFGTVEVEQYLQILRFSHVMHIGSTVKGKLRSDVKPVDVVGAVLPAGTLSGAPKIRACEIIDELEGVKRGVYGGALGYLGFNGELDTCIAIRIAYKKNGKVFVRAGAGVVADSVPELEYKECRNKMGAVLAALEEAAK